MMDFVLQMMNSIPKLMEFILSVNVAEDENSKASLALVDYADGVTKEVRLQRTTTEMWNSPLISGFCMNDFGDFR